jgi:hypothetical protein
MESLDLYKEEMAKIEQHTQECKLKNKEVSILFLFVIY